MRMRSRVSSGGGRAQPVRPRPWGVGARRSHPGHGGLLIAAVFAILCWYGQAGAQVPVIDRNMGKQTGQTMVARLGEWYAIAVHWRDAMLGRAKEMVNQTRELVRMREQYEEKFLGELGTLGGLVPDTRKFTRACAYDANGVLVCSLSRFIARNYERELASTVLTYASPLFQTIASVDSTVNALIGQQTVPGFDVAETFLGTTQGKLASADSALRAVGKRGPDLMAIGQRLNLIIDQVSAEEIAGKELSSQRARIVHNALDEAEGEVAIALARANLDNLELTALLAGEEVASYRGSKRGVHGLGFGW